jgi:dolichol-phosphate mannosyltransferase
VKAILMARNFGSNQPSILAGMHEANGDCVIIVDGDIQDPPELIPQFVTKWEEGFDVVYGIRKKRKGNILRRIGYKCFYVLFHWMSYLDIPLDAGDFSLIDRKVVNVINQLPEKDLYIRGLRSWAGFNQTGIEYVRDDRTAGKTSNSFFANFSWAKKAIVNFSYKPLEFISRLAAVTVGLTIIAAFIYLYQHFQTASPRGFSTLLMVMFIFGSIQLLALSIIGEYLIKIFNEVKGRPPYIIKKILQKDKK